MKPNAALLFSTEAVEALIRSPRGWLSLGRVRFDASDLDAQLEAFRAQARRLGAEPVRTKLILPASEVRYATVYAPGPTDEARRLQIETEIEQLTPYQLDEIVFDWVIEGDNALVAVAARETLAEAEEFAQSRGYAPVSFSAIPEAGEFIGEPFLGHTRLAAAILPRGTKVDPDLEPVSVAGSATLPAQDEVAPAPEKSAAAVPKAPEAVLVPQAPEAVAAPKAPETVLPKAPEAAPVPKALETAEDKADLGKAAVEPAAAQPTAPKPAVAAPAIGAPAPAAPADRAPPKPVPVVSEGAPAAPGKAVPSAPIVALPPAPPAALAPKVGGPLAPSTPANAVPKGAPTGDEGLQRIGNFVRRLGTQMRRERAAAQTPPTAPPPQLAAEPLTPAFSTRRKPVDPGTAAGSPQGRPAQLALASTGAPKAGPGPGGRIAVVGGALAGGALAGARARAGKLAGDVSAKGRNLGAQVRAKLSATPAISAPLNRPVAQDAAKVAEAESMTIFGARQGQKVAAGPRRGVMLAGGLALLLIAVGIWVAFLGRSPAPTEQAGLPVESTAPISAPGDLPLADDPDTLLETLVREGLIEPVPADSLSELAETGGEPAPEPGLMADADPALEPTPEALPDAAAEALAEALADALTQAAPEAQSLPAPETTATAAPPGVAALDETPSTRLALAQPLTLPEPLSPPDLSETPFSPPSPPPPFGVEFTLGPDGLVVPTPEGTLTPDGIIVRSGRPAAVPPARPAGLVPDGAAVTVPEATATVVAAVLEAIDAPEAAEALSEPAVAEVAPETLVNDPALAGFRPRPRLVPDAPPAPAADDGAAVVAAPEAASEATTEELDTPTAGAVSLTALRPQARPSDLTAPVPAAEASPADPGLAVSVMPPARPDGLEVRAPVALAAAAAAAPQAAAAAPGAGPQIPTTASVAERATQARAINLRQINLIGVFGTPSDRRALVRLSDGRVVRLQVGDVLDGGRVSAIGEDELRYTRSGRNEVLRIGSS